jgi:hypothetical protein
MHLQIQKQKVYLCVYYVLLQFLVEAIASFSVQKKKTGIVIEKQLHQICPSYIKQPAEHTKFMETFTFMLTWTQEDIKRMDPIRYLHK